MQKRDINTVRFEKLSLHNYGIFHGSNDFVFNRQRTLIVGAGGTGKTTIMNALDNLGTAPGVKPYFGADSQETYVTVSTYGNPELVKKYGSVIFLGGEFRSSDQEALFADVLDEQCRIAIKDEARTIFCTLLERKPWKLKAHRDLDSNMMAVGEMVCLSFAFAFAVRKALNLDLPVVLDNPYGCLDSKLTASVSAFLGQQECQQILLLSETEYAMIYEGNDVHYKLGRRE